VLIPSPAAGGPDARAGAQEQLLRSVVDSLDARMCVLGDHGGIVGTNVLWDELALLMNWPPAQSGVGGSLFDLLATVAGDLSRDVVTAARDLLSGTAGHCAIKGFFPFPDQGEDVVVRLHPVRDHDVARVVLTMINITETTRTQRDLRRVTEEAQLLALVAQHTDNAVVISDAEGRIEWANDAFCQANGYTLDELVGVRRQDIVHGPFLSTPAFARFSAALSSGRGASLEMPIQTRDGRCRWTQVEVTPIIEDGNPVRLVGIERDITLQRTAQEQLRAATAQAHLLAERVNAEKKLLSEVLGSIPHLVYWKDADLRYTGVNQAFLTLRALAGEDTVLERTEAELDSSDALSELLASIEPQVLASGQGVENHRLVLAGGDQPACSLLLSVLPHTDDQGAVCGVIGVAADVTHVTTLEQQLAQATKLESIGQLAAGIAHEINTPVQYVSDNTRFLSESFGGVLAALRRMSGLAGGSAGADDIAQVMRELDLEFLAEEIPSALSQSQEGLARVAQIVRAMKDFSHPGQGRAEADLNRAIESTVQVSRNEWRYVAGLELDLADDIGRVPCYEGELKQVMLNIIVNAAQAIAAERERTGSQESGRIRIRTERLSDEIRITVSDDGPGMSDEIRHKIFDPFFTTKPVGQGTGQGLSMAYAVIVQKHAGSLTVTSSPGAGSTFVIGLPTALPPERA
jgi:PAS domain S-box-containing protein